MPVSSTKASIAVLRVATRDFIQSSTSSKMRREMTAAASALVMLVCGIVAAPSAHASNFSVLYTFNGQPSDGDQGYGGLLVDKLGNLEGTTFVGGSDDGGTLFALDSTG